MTQTLERPVEHDVLDLEAMSNVLVSVVERHSDPLSKRQALIEAARELKVSLSQMSYALIYARSAGLIKTNSVDSTIRVVQKARRD
jgi:hypothetical protein